MSLFILPHPRKKYEPTVGYPQETHFKYNDIGMLN